MFPRELFARIKALTQPTGNHASNWIRQAVLEAVESAEARRAAQALPPQRKETEDSQ